MDPYRLQPPGTDPLNPYYAKPPTSGATAAVSSTQSSGPNRSTHATSTPDNHYRRSPGGIMGPGSSGLVGTPHPSMPPPQMLIRQHPSVPSTRFTRPQQHTNPGRPSSQQQQQEIPALPHSTQDQQQPPHLQYPHEPQQHEHTHLQPRPVRSAYWDTVLASPPSPRGGARRPAASLTSGLAEQSATRPPSQQHGVMPSAHGQLPESPRPPPSPHWQQHSRRDPRDEQTSHSGGTAGGRFACAECGLQCARRGHLERHVLAVHQNVKQFRCPHGCPRPFGHRSSLARHMRKVHGRSSANGSGRAGGDSSGPNCPSGSSSE